MPTVWDYVLSIKADRMWLLVVIGVGRWRWLLPSAEANINVMPRFKAHGNQIPAGSWGKNPTSYYVQGSGALRNRQAFDPPS
jgi:hypothetical protein